MSELSFNEILHTLKAKILRFSLFDKLSLLISFLILFCSIFLPSFEFCPNQNIRLIKVDCEVCGNRHNLQYCYENIFYWILFGNIVLINFFSFNIVSKNDSKYMYSLIVIFVLLLFYLNMFISAGWGNPHGIISKIGFYLLLISAFMITSISLKINNKKFD